MALHRTSGRTRLGAGLAATTVLAWGTLPVALSVVLETLDAITITWVRFCVSGAILWLWLGRRGALPELSRLRGREVGLLTVATLGLAINYVLFVGGLEHTTPANVQILIQLSPLLLALGGIAVFGERFNRVQWLGFGVLVAGLGIFFADQLAASVDSDGEYLLGSAMILVAAITWAIYGLAQKQLLVTFSSQALLLCIYVGCALGLTAFTQPATLLDLGAVRWAVLLYCALNTVVGYGAFSAALEHLEASRVGAILALTPLATLVFVGLAHVWMPGLLPPEHLSATMLVGATAVVAGSVLTSRG
jgi:drug/metabolite transporter (DMT)-like permease